MSSAPPPYIPALPPRIKEKKEPEVQEDIIDLLFSKIDLDFNFLDKELEKQNIPKDLTQLIFSFAIPYCKECNDCCSICKYYCSIECLRYQRVNACCRHELNQLLRRYENN